MDLREQKNEYVAQYSGYVPAERLNRYLEEGIEFFEARGIELPAEGDYQLWHEEQKTRPGRKAGEFCSDRTITDYERKFRKITTWLESSTQMIAEASEATQEGSQVVHEPESEVAEETPHMQSVHKLETSKKPRGRNGGRKVKDAGAKNAVKR